MGQQRRLAGRRALITGSGTGIGREVALEFARQGADVALHYATSAQGAQRALAEIEAMGRRSTALQADLGTAEACFGLVDDAVAFLGSIDILVNNAGISASEEFLKVTPQHFDRLLRVNFQGQFFCAQRAVRHMVEQGHGGCVINMTSSHAVSSLPGFSVYAGTKGALWSWTHQLAVELAPLGIRVNGVCPGWVVVESHYDQVPDFDPEAISPHIPYRRMGYPLDIARACVFLASEDSDYMIGHVMVVDGGTMAKLALPEHGKGEGDPA
jgi:NAD(P)-dependent dehydrogenase (short-subunit alcohol dehydrogenase family)